MEAFALPKETEQEKGNRTATIQAATLYATEVPLRTMRVAYSAFDLVEAMVKEGNPNSISDAGVGALCLRSAIFGAFMNVKINSKDLKDKILANKLVTEANEIFNSTVFREKVITDAVLKIIEG